MRYTCFFLFGFFLMSTAGLAQPANDYCDGALVLDEQFVADEDCIDNGWRTLTADFVGAHASPNLVNCIFDSARTLWYAFPVSDEQFLLSFKISGVPGSAPALTLFSGDCSALTVVEPCRVAYHGPLYVMDVTVEPNTTYYLVCGDITNQSDTMRMSWGKHDPGAICISSDKIEPVYRSGGGSPSGPYLPGDTIGFNYEVYFKVSTGVQNCQWLQGVVPVFGAGWDPASFDTLGQPRNATMNDKAYPAPNLYNEGHWSWWTDIRYHHTNCFLNVGDFDGNGTWDLCDGRFDPDCSGPGLAGGCCGPCWNSSGPNDPGDGDVLPPGWFSAGVEGSCAEPFVGWPAVDWGDGNTCDGYEGPWNFYFELIVPEDLTSTNSHGDFSIVMHTMADGETGAWWGSSSVCAGDYPERYDANVIAGCEEEDGVAFVGGVLFADYMADCTYDGNEPGLRYRVIAFKRVGSGAQRLVLTDRHGKYSMQIDTGTYWAVPQYNGIEPQLCPDSVMVSFSEPCAEYQVNFAVDNDSLCPEDLGLQLITGPLRICANSIMTVALYNDGEIDVIAPRIELSLDSLLEFLSATVEYDDLSNNEFLLYAPDIPAGGQVYVQIHVRTSCDAPVGYLHCSEVHLVNALCGMLDVTALSCQPNMNPIDPNFKVDGKDFSFEATEISDNSPIEYQIHFQNTGTTYAEYVTLLDTLPELLDPFTFHFKGSSHPVNVSLKQNHILQFTFPNINLPDSTTNEPGSHGVVVFEIQPVNGLVVGQTILNDAAIYFDYNPPVLTNLKQHTVACGIEITLDSVSVTPDAGGDSGAITIHPPAGATYSYLWSTGDSTSVVGDLAAGEYNVTISNEMGCKKVFTFEVGTQTGIKEDHHRRELHVYPNPVHDLLYIQIPAPHGSMTLEVRSLNGQVLINTNLANEQLHQLDISNLATGIYVCIMKSSDGIAVAKFVRQ